MKTPATCLVLTLFSGLIPLGAQGLQLQGPASGLVYDGASRSIRPILGFPGGAHLGAAIYADLDYASVAPNGRMALAVRAGQVLLIQQLLSPEPAATVLASAIANPTRALWAGDSSSAVLCSGESLSLQRISNLPDAPSIEDPVQIPVSDGELVSLAADQSARQIVAGIRGGSAGGLYFLSKYGDVSLLAAMDDPSAAVFTPDGLNLYAADRAIGQVLLFWNVAAGATPAVLLDSQSGVSDPVGLAVTVDHLYVVSGAQQTIRVYDPLALNLAAETQLDNAPEGIEPIPQSSLYLLTRRNKPDDVLLLIDTRHGLIPFFVPAGD